MNITRLAQARRLFTNNMAPRSVCRHNMRQWARALRYLGDRWLLASQVREVPDGHDA